MNKKKLILSIILSLFVVAILVLVIIKLNNSQTTNEMGEIQVKIVELDGTVSDLRTIKFEEGDSLVGILEEEYDNIVITDGMIMTISTLTTPADWSTFISIKVNGEDSMVGILQIELVDEMIIEFVDTEVIW